MLTTEELYHVATPGTFGRAIEPDYYYHRHIRHIDEAIMAMVNKTAPPMLIVEMPPRHGKTQLIGKYLPTWYLGHNPSKQVLFASATGDLAGEAGYEAMHLFRNHAPHYFGVGLAQDKRSNKDWKTTKGGGMRCAGIGGDLTGRDGNLLIVDDYMRSPQDAISPTVREKQWDWFHSVFMARLMPDVMILVMGTRWWKDDIIGRIIDPAFSFPYRRIRLPAIADEGDDLGRKPGEALWPEMWPIGEKSDLVENDFGQRVPGLALRKSTMTPHWWTAQYQQTPSTHGRTMFPEEYFGGKIWVPAMGWPREFERKIVALDASMGKTAEIKKGDYSGIIFAGLTGGKVYCAADIKRRSPNGIVDAVVELCRVAKPDALAIESNSFQGLFKELIDLKCQELSIPPLPIVLVNHPSSMSKEARITRLGPYLANDVLRFREDGDCPLLIEQLREFPLSEHDDGPDALELAIDTMQQLAAETYEPVDHVFDVARI